MGNDGFMRVLPSIAAACALIIGLAGCSTSATPEPEPTREPRTVQPEPTPTESPEPEPEQAEKGPIVIPACTEIFADPTTIGNYFGEGAQLLDFDIAASGSIHGMGPSAEQALAAATQKQGCMWGLQNSDTFSRTAIAEIPDEVAASLISELRASDYVESAHRGYPVFVYEVVMDPNPIPYFVWYGFAGNAWVMAFSTWGPHEESSKAILDAVTAATPHLE